jgi:hypothetical protein
MVRVEKRNGIFQGKGQIVLIRRLGDAILKRCGVKVWASFNCLRIGSSGGIF